MCVTACSFIISTIFHICMFPLFIRPMWHTCLDLGYLNPCLALMLCQIVCVLMPDSTELFFGWFSWFWPCLSCCCPGKWLFLCGQASPSPCLFPFAWDLILEGDLFWSTWDYFLDLMGTVFFEEQRLFFNKVPSLAVVPASACDNRGNEVLLFKLNNLHCIFFKFWTCKSKDD